MLKQHFGKLFCAVLAAVCLCAPLYSVGIAPAILAEVNFGPGPGNVIDEDTDNKEKVETQENLDVGEAETKQGEDSQETSMLESDL